MQEPLVNQKLLEETFRKMQQSFPERFEEYQQKVDKVAALLEGRFDREHCWRALNIIKAQYDVLPDRDKAGMAQRISIHFNHDITEEEAIKILNILVFNTENFSKATDFLAEMVAANSGLASDAPQEHENEKGRFGYDLTHPIGVNGIDRINAYFSRLRLLTGESIVWERRGSVISEDLPFPVDQYEIFNSDGQSIAHLFVYAYHGKMSERAPQGFKWVE
ncbi:MAG: hypothetical protein ACK4VN_15265 [Bacteroidales bacterium]